MSPNNTESQRTNRGPSSRKTIFSWFRQISLVVFAALVLSSVLAAQVNTATLQICNSSLGCSANETQFTPGDTVYITGSGWDSTISEDVELQITEVPPHG